MQHTEGASSTGVNDTYDAVPAYDDAGAADPVRAGLDAGIPVATILDDGLIAPICPSAV